MEEVTESSAVTTQGEVTKRFGNGLYEKNYYQGDAAGAVQYKPKVAEYTGGKQVKYYVWEPGVHSFDLPPEHRGSLLTVFVE